MTAIALRGRVATPPGSRGGTETGVLSKIAAALEQAKRLHLRPRQTCQYDEELGVVRAVTDRTPLSDRDIRIEAASLLDGRLLVAVTGPEGDVALYADGAFLYAVADPNERFAEDLRRRTLIDPEHYDQDYERQPFRIPGGAGRCR